MIEQQVEIINKLGLHARAAAKFVGLASRYISQIKVIKGSQEVNGKSIMGVMMLAASKGTLLTLQIEGDDEQEMSDSLLALINNFFDEPQE